MKIYVKKVKNTSGEIKESLWIRFNHNNQLHRKPLRLENSKANMKLAKEKILPMMQLKLFNGEFFESKVPTLSEYYKKSFELHKAHRRETTTQDNLAIFYKHILPSFGSKKLDEIKPSDITIWQNKLLFDNELSSKRVKDIRCVLSVIMEDAFRDEIINRNPIKLASSLPQHIAKTITPFTLSEIYKIINTAENQYKNFFAISFFTGIRTGELIGLRWSDVDIHNREIHIKRSVRKGLETLPKTTSSIRTVELIDAVIEFFEKQFELTGSKDSYVFLTSNDNNLYDAKTIRAHAWLRTLKKANIDYRPLYQTRHTFATQMIQNGEDILWVASMLGHSSPKMTLDKYAKYIKSETKKRGTFISDTINTK